MRDEHGGRGRLARLPHRAQRQPPEAEPQCREHLRQRLPFGGAGGATQAASSDPNRLPLIVVLEESPAGLAAEIPSLDHARHALRGKELRVSGAAVDVHRRLEDDVDAAEV